MHNFHLSWILKNVQHCYELSPLSSQACACRWRTQCFLLIFNETPVQLRQLMLRPAKL